MTVSNTQLPCLETLKTLKEYPKVIITGPGPYWHTESQFGIESQGVSGSLYFPLMRTGNAIAPTSSITLLHFTKKRAAFIGLFSAISYGSTTALLRCSMKMGKWRKCSLGYTNGVTDNGPSPPCQPAITAEIRHPEIGDSKWRIALKSKEPAPSAFH